MMLQIHEILDSDSYFEIEIHEYAKSESFAHDFVRKLFHPEGKKLQSCLIVILIRITVLTIIVPHQSFHIQHVNGYSSH